MSFVSRRVRTPWAVGMSNSAFRVVGPRGGGRFRPSYFRPSYISTRLPLEQQRRTLSPSLQNTCPSPINLLRGFSSIGDGHWKSASKPVAFESSPLSVEEVTEVLVLASGHIREIVAENPEFARGLLELPQSEKAKLEWLHRLVSLKKVLERGGLNKRPGQGKTKLFALLMDIEKKRILELSGADGADAAAHLDMGKTTFFAALPSAVKYGALKKWQQERAAQIAATGASGDQPEEFGDLGKPPRGELIKLFFSNGVPMIGFGFADNFLMIVFGGAIDNFFGVYVSTMAAYGVIITKFVQAYQLLWEMATFARGGAALGNLCSNIVGLSLADWIEHISEKMGIPAPKLSVAQRDTNVVRACQLAGTCWGVTVGCLLGMVPLLFLNFDGDDGDGISDGDGQESSEGKT